MRTPAQRRVAELSGAACGRTWRAELAGHYCTEPPDHPPPCRCDCGATR